MIVPSIPEGCVYESATLLFGGADAVRSDDGTYRYWLSRTWNESGACAVWLMLNPSTADAWTDDATIRRCVRFTLRWGLSGLVVVNLFGLRATDPRELRKHSDPVGPANGHFIGEAVRSAPVVIAAWGACREAGHPGAEVASLVGEQCGMLCLGTTKDGFPRHPLFVRGDTELRPFEPESEAA